MRNLIRALVCGALAASMAYACGGDSSSDGSGGKKSSGGSGGSDAGGSGGTAGAAGSSGGVAGTGGSGGAAGSGGSAGTGGTGGTVACDPPTDPSKSAVCIQLVPEAMKFVPGDPALDGKGVLVVQIFDAPLTELPDGGEIPPIASLIMPASTGDGGQGEDTLAGATQAPLRFDNLPAGAPLYARALFFDDTTVLTTNSKFPVSGVWIGGVDLSNGLEKNTPLTALSLSAGLGTGVSQKLWALRKLSVEVSRAPSVSPKGNGQGSVSFVATDQQQASAAANVFASGSVGCADLSGTNKVTIDGIVIGTGPYWLAAILDDYGLGPNDLTGALASLEVTDGGLQIPAANKLVYATDAYTVSATVQLGFAFDPPDGGADAVSCSTGDASTD